MRYIIASRLIAPRCSIGLRSLSTGSGPSDHSGTAGAIRDAGGAFARLELAYEQEYIHRQQSEQLQKLKEERLSKMEYHQNQIDVLGNALKRHKEMLAKLKK